MHESRDNRAQEGGGGGAATPSTEFGGLFLRGRGLEFQVTREVITADTIEAAVSVIAKCFTLEADLESAKLSYQRFVAGLRRYHSEFSETEVELLSYHLYRVGAEPAAVAGAYKLVNDPGRIYMGWLGVAPEFRKNRNPGMKPLSEVIMEDTIAFAKEQGATGIAAVAEDASANRNTHAYYERHGFKVERTFDRNGERDRLYVLDLQNTFPGEISVMSCERSADEVGRRVGQVAAMAELKEGYETPMREISLHGTPFEIGRMHGELLGSLIGDVVQVYMDLFGALGGGDREAIRASAQVFADRIEKFDSRYMEEIRGIASGSGIDLRDILAINARTEILTSLLASSKECTLFCFAHEGILAQTWDWLRRLEGKPVLLRVRHDDGHTVLTMTEPGIVGKIGINSAGLGVGLNILSSSQRAEGVPVHVLLRSALDARSWEEAHDRLTKSNIGTNSAITLADDKGRCMTYEYKGDDLKVLQPRAGVLVHTNHYIADPSDSPIPDSVPRLRRAESLIAGLTERTVESAKVVLGDRTSEEGTICIPWKDEGEWGDMGTVCSAVMDLKHRKLYISRGHPGSYATNLQVENRVDIAYDEHTV
jgi:isopenicillin-N N-acyltransferase-like protein